MSYLLFEISNISLASVGKCMSVMIKYWPYLNYFSITANTWLLYDVVTFTISSLGLYTARPPITQHFEEVREVQ
jgi:hypothetical protein